MVSYHTRPERKASRLAIEETLAGHRQRKKIMHAVSRSLQQSQRQIKRNQKRKASQHLYLKYPLSTPHTIWQ